MRVQALLRPVALLVSASIFLLGSAVAQADDLQDVTRLISAGSYGPALDKANAYLAAHPKDAQGRFLKGIVLTETGKQADAIQIFSALTEEFPELPEPYNNLAVIYASQGQYEKARNALELAIHTHPSYGTAHENLGDVYAKLATKSYDKALQLDKNNTTAATKLSMIKGLFNTSPTAVAKADSKPESRADSKPESRTETTAAASAATKVAAAAPTAKPAKEAKESEGGKDSADQSSAAETARMWAQAWSSKDVEAYLGYYGSDFKTPNGESRADWEKQRRERLGKPGPITVALHDVKVTLNGKDTAQVSFKQKYSSTNLKSSNDKTLVLQRKGDHWMIVEERVRG